MPLLSGHALPSSTHRPDPGPPGVLTRLFRVAGPAAVLAHEQALLHDPTWHRAMRELGAAFGGGHPLPYHFGFATAEPVPPSYNPPRQAVEDLDLEAATEERVEHFIGESPALRKFLAQLAQAAATDLPVLITGASGTGKHLAALKLHELSPRASEPFVPVPLSSTAPDRQELALFGDGVRQLGHCFLVQRGTVLLDEIGALSPHLQWKLYRLLVARSFERVDGSQVLPFYGRLVATTNRDLERCVERGTFRPDLHAQLQLCTVRVPTLDERREDILLLAYRFLARAAAHQDKQVLRLSEEAELLLKSAEWRGNVRDLKEIIRVAVARCTGQVVHPRHLPAPGKVPYPLPDRPSYSLVELEAQHLREVLQRTRWVLDGPQGAAALLGMPVPELRERMRTLGVRPR